MSQTTLYRQTFGILATSLEGPLLADTCRHIRYANALPKTKPLSEVAAFSAFSALKNTAYVGLGDRLHALHIANLAWIALRGFRYA